MNGELFFETTENFNHRALLNLKTLHATISMIKNKLKANFGSLPFRFDVLNYQQQVYSTPLYSEISKHLNIKRFYFNINNTFSCQVQSHFLAFQDEETIPLLQDTNSRQFVKVCDYNIPNFDFDLPHFLYMITYSRQHPQGNYQMDDLLVPYSLWLDLANTLYLKDT